MRADGHYAPTRPCPGHQMQRPRPQESTTRPNGASRRGAPAAFVVPPSGPNQVWQLDFTEFETRMAAPGGSAGSPTTGRSSSSAGTSHRPEPPRRDRDGRARARRDQRLPGRALPSSHRRATGEIRPVALVTDNGPCFKSGRFAAFVDKRPELIHIRTAQEPRPKRRPRTRLRLAKVRAPLPPRDRRRPRPRPTGRAYRSSSTRSGPTNPSPADARSSPPRSHQRPRPSSQTSPKPCHFVKQDRYATRFVLLQGIGIPHVVPSRAYFFGSQCRPFVSIHRRRRSWAISGLSKLQFDTSFDRRKQIEAH